MRSFNVKQEFQQFAYVSRRTLRSQWSLAQRRFDKGCIILPAQKSVQLMSPALEDRFERSRGRHVLQSGLPATLSSSTRLEIELQRVIDLARS
jgi:hypothetical protein